MGKYITNIHVSNRGKNDRFSLEDGVDEWIKYVEAINQYSDNSIDRYYLLEFVKDDNLIQFNDDVLALEKIVQNIDLRS